MDASFRLSIITPDGQVYEDQVESMVAPGEWGSFGVLAGHAPMVSALQPGVLSVTSHGDRFHFAVGAGLAEVSEGDVTILADSADQAESPDEARQVLGKKSALGGRV